MKLLKYFKTLLITITWTFGWQFLPLSKALANIGTETQLSGGGGADGGGAGTFVKTNSNSLIFWDLFINNPNFIETEFGDQIQLYPGGSIRKFLGQWVDYRKFRSFAYLNQRLNLWQNRAPNFVKMIKTDGFIDSQDLKRSKYNLLFIASKYFIQNIDEIFVPQEINLKNISVLPTGFFQNENAYLFVTAQYWNQAGIISQAAFLLHERMRENQLRYSITNKDLQKFVYYILLKDPTEISQDQFNDQYFANPAFEQTVPKFGGGLMYAPVRRVITDLYLTCSLTEDRDKVINCFNNSNEFNRIEPLMDGGREAFFKNLRNIQDWNSKDLIGVNQEIEEAIKAGTLGNNVTHVKPKNQGVNNFISNPGEYILEPATCTKIISDYKDPKFFNSSRDPLYCENGVLKGVGGLLFKNSSSDDLIIEVNAHLYTRNDAGSQISLRFFQNKQSWDNGLTVNISLARYDGFSLIVHGFNSDLINGAWDLKPINSDHNHFSNLIVKASYKNKKIEIYSDKSGNWKESRPLMTINIPDEVLKKIDGFNWSYYTENHSNVRTIRLLK